jgi:hypothetical protein
MQPLVRRSLALVALSCVLLTANLAGCRSKKAETFQVTGTVKLTDGTPLEGGRLLFRPEGETVYAAKGDVRSDGTFELSTFGIGDGAVAGAHRVMVLPPVPEGFMDEPRTTPGTRLAIDLKYQSLRTSPLEFTVEPGGENHFDIAVEPLKRRGK